jgi:hypothetical protein
MVATLAGVSRRGVQRADRESRVTHIGTAREREARGMDDPQGGGSSARFGAWRRSGSRADFGYADPGARVFTALRS